ncbi:meiotic recombination protein REC12 [Cryptosporidium andersoni]|uniref:DNA topoisomerase (ATP-hydrolyzing) n=1 Tax=Cryptosporidium andersoni TaxID=117008 RepID=A0A1J4MSM9_9CRYT|nr:meiotic recombination protein REC12 [Cryptosporidium andersoni]
MVKNNALKSDDLSHFSENNIVCQLEWLIFKLFKNTKKYQCYSKVYQMTCIISITNTLHGLVSEGYHATLRDIFYSNPSLYKKQTISNNTIAMITRLIRIPREFLNVVSTSKGMIRGPISVFGSDLSGDKYNRNKIIEFDCLSKIEGMGHSISPYICRLMNNWRINIYKNISFVLIIEKDTVFQRLLECNFLEAFNNSCILLTAKGYSDLPTRALLYQLCNILPYETLFWILCDYDAHGLTIGATYIMGSQNSAWYDSDFKVDRILPFPLPRVADQLANGIIHKQSIFQLSKSNIVRINMVKQRFENCIEVSSNIRAQWIKICEQIMLDGVEYEIDCIEQLENWVEEVIKKKLASINTDELEDHKEYSYKYSE